MEVETLPKGTVVKLDGLPLELLVDTPIKGDVLAGSDEYQSHQMVAADQNVIQE